MADTAQTPVWKLRLFVVGHVAKGVVFILIGGLGTYAAIHGTRDPQGMVDALTWLYTQTFGMALVSVLGLGLLAHGVWRWMKAFEGGTNGRSKLVAIGQRVGHAVGGTFYILLSVFSCSMLWVEPQTSSDQGTKEEVLQFTLKIPWGEWAVGLVGAIVILVGMIIAVRGSKRQLMDELDTGHMEKWERRAYRMIGMGGHLAWGMINGIIGYFLIRVALTSEPEKFRGIKGALEFMGGRTFGTLLLIAVSAGLLLFGLFMFAKARYDRTN